MIYCFDIDNTICHTEGTDYENAEPNWPVIERIKALHEEGHEIRYYTGRGWGEKSTCDFSRWVKLANLAHRQIKGWGLPEAVINPKPPADVYVDDRAVNVNDWMPGRPAKLPPGQPRPTIYTKP